MSKTKKLKKLETLKTCDSTQRDHELNEAIAKLIPGIVCYGGYKSGYRAKNPVALIDRATTALNFRWFFRDEVFNARTKLSGCKGCGQQDIVAAVIRYINKQRKVRLPPPLVNKIMNMIHSYNECKACSLDEFQYTDLPVDDD